MLVHEIYSRLKSADLLSKYSLQDFVVHPKYIQLLKANNFWATGEISGKTQKLLDTLAVHIT